MADTGIPPVVPSEFRQYEYAWTTYIICFDEGLIIYRHSVLMPKLQHGSSSSQGYGFQEWAYLFFSFFLTLSVVYVREEFFTTSLESERRLTDLLRCTIWKRMMSVGQMTYLCNKSKE